MEDQMRVLFDTNILVAALVELHPFHEECLNWLEKAKLDEVSACMSCHSLAETYSQLTNMPIRPRITCAIAQKLILDDIIPYVQAIELTRTDYVEVIQRNVTQSIIGGTTYDALIAHAFLKSEADYLITSNLKHFRMILPAHSDRIIAPDEKIRND